MTQDELEFSIFCVESVAERLNIGGDAVYKLLSKDSNLLDTYIVPNHVALHSQGREYIVNDIIENMKKEGLFK